MGDSTLVYMCVFYNRFYLKLLKLLMSSVRLNVPHLERYTFLVLTSADFKDEVDSISALVGIPIRVHILDIHSFFHSAAAKCRIYEYPSVDDFSQILYIDTDILVLKDLADIFAGIPADSEKIYGIEDGILSHPGNGGWYFTPEICASPSNTPAVNTGVLAFRNTPHIRSVFEECCDFMFSTEKKGGDMPCCLEQPFINFIFYKRGSIDSQLMKRFVSLGEPKGEPLCMVHFLAPIGDGQGKFKRMCAYMSDRLANSGPISGNRDLILKNKSFEWVHESGKFVTFREGGKVETPWGGGDYAWCDSRNGLETAGLFVNFGGCRHYWQFFGDSKFYITARIGDCNIVSGSQRQKTQNEVDYDVCEPEKERMLADIKDIVVKSGDSLEGNSFYVHGTTTIYEALYNKQVNLFWSGRRAETRICEIGFNAGHSVMLMLMGREKTGLDFTVFDIGRHAYTKPCLEYIKDTYPHVCFEYIEGDSAQTMTEWIAANPSVVGTYDVVHVDGGHTEHCISHDMKNADALLKPGGIMIVDDTYDSIINSYVNLYISTKGYMELHLLETVGYTHRIIVKLV